MASMTAAAVAVPSFCGLRAEQAAVSSSTRVAMAPVSARPVAVLASNESIFTKVSKVALAGVAASVLLAGSASATQVIKMGADDGGLVFEPNNVTVSTGEEVQFINNKGFPHNVQFDDDEIPDGVDSDDINSDYLNGPGEVHSVKFSVPGTYAYYCGPHQAANMKGVINVK